MIWPFRTRADILSERFDLVNKRLDQLTFRVNILEGRELCFACTDFFGRETFHYLTTPCEALR